MKTYNIIFATLAMALLAVSCQKAAVGGAQEPEEAPVPVQLTTNLKVNSMSVTKAAVDAWAAQTLYIYALPSNTISETGILVNNASALAPNDGDTAEGRYEPKPIELKDGDQYYYYPTNKETFDFYGYYVGNPNEAPNPTIGDNHITLPIVLDGSQDIMLAKADKEEDVLAATELISPANAYGAYSARKGVVPNLKFEHQLARFVFNVVAGDDDGMNVQIKKVELTSKNEATLVIASKKEGVSRGISNPTGEGNFSLKSLDGSELSPRFPQNEVQAGQQYTFVEGDRIGESIMVIPNNEGHKMVMTLQQKSSRDDGATNVGASFKIERNLLPGDVEGAQEGNEFLPGYQYNVNVVVYGRKKVEVKVTLTKWAEGGNIIIDDNEDWGDEPKLGLKATKDNTDYYLYFYDSSIVAKTDETPGTEVRVWDQASNTMVPAEPGTYKFTAAVQGFLYVTLAQEGEGETLKTVVTGLSAGEPTP